MATDFNSFLAQLMQPAQQAPVPEPVQPEQPGTSADDPTETGNMAENILRGLMNKPGPTPLSRQEFDQKYRKNINPAREALADALLGMSSSMLGTKFQSAREGAWNKTVQDYTLKKQAFDEEHKAQQEKLGMLALLQKEQAQRRTNELGKAMVEIRKETDVNKQRAMLAALNQKGELDTKKMALAEAQFRAKKEHDAVMEDRTGDHIFDAAKQRVNAELVKDGIDPTTPQGRALLEQRTMEQWVKMQGVLHPPRAAGGGSGAPAYSIQKIRDPEGNEHLVAIDRKNPKQVMTVGPQYRNLSAAQVDSINLMQTAAQSVRSAMEVARDNPGMVGSMGQRIPFAIRKATGMADNSEMMVHQNLDQAQMLKILASSGKAVTDSERQWVLQSWPSLYQKGKVFYPSAYSMSTMLDGLALKQQYNLDLDLSKVSRMEAKRMETAVKANGGKLPPDFHALSGKELLEASAILHKKKLVRDDNGTMRLE